jgi:pimeloyl-ACP methyl ester carboxylesterase
VCHEIQRKQSEIKTYKMERIKLNNYEFGYNEKGEGELIVFVHGSVSDYRTWENQINEFSKKHHTIRYSRRYHWPNEKISESEDYSMYQHVNDLEELLKKQKKPVTLIGHSYGAFICLMVAMKSSELIKRLTLSEPPVITLFGVKLQNRGKFFIFFFKEPVKHSH